MIQVSESYENQTTYSLPIDWTIGQDITYWSMTMSVFLGI